MSPKFPVLSGKEMVTALERSGFQFVSQKGSHRKMRGDSGKVVIIPMHDELAIGTLRSILRQADIHPDELTELLW